MIFLFSLIYLFCVHFNFMGQFYFVSSPYSLFCLDRMHTSAVIMKNYLNAHNIFYFAAMYQESRSFIQVS